jgi:two-component sensor histidine kinase
MTPRPQGRACYPDCEATLQREILIREVHHRIKNNLQTVVGLLRREAGKMPQACPAIEAAIGQVQAIAVVHGLQGRISGRAVMLCELLPDIVGMAADLAGAKVCMSGVPPGSGGLYLSESETVAVALVLNELVTNAVKHRATPQPPRIELSVSGALARISIVNTGMLPADFDFSGGKGVGNGLGLVRALMSPKGMTLTFCTSANEVEAQIELVAPVVHIDPKEEMK